MSKKNNWRSNSMNLEAFDEIGYEKLHTARHEKHIRDARKDPHQEKQFRCQNCGLLVSTDPELAGVQNRNHCPNCLWSKHVDLNKAGDRKATCQARMQPIGLTVKQNGKKYSASGARGELMLIHRCTACARISINRIAADDAAGQIYRLYRISFDMEERLRQILVEQGIHLLQAADLTTVFSQLFGWQSILEEFQTQPHLLMQELDQQYLTVR